jgi:hypothetical protein
LGTNPPIILATVYLKSQTGRSLLGDRHSPPAEVTAYLPSAESIEKAATELEKLGFKIEARGMTLSISGPPCLFERLCGVKISSDGSIETAELKSLYIRAGDPVLHIKQLNRIVEGIVLARPGIPI